MTSGIMSRLFFSIGVTLAASLYRFGFTSAAPHLRDANFETLMEKNEKEHPHQLIVADTTKSFYTPEANQDRILDLPGLNYDPGFNQFSGYLTVDETNQRNIFYWYVESENDPKNDPLVFWTNGGPGCSGLLGFGTEHGPFSCDWKGTLRPNPFSWNKVANILYVEQPAGVGFSFSYTESDYVTGDDKAAADNYVLITEFLKRFPERQPNDFYVASESYGGHYIPQLTMQILNQNKDGNINFKGFLVGNPYVDPYTNTVTQFAALYAHGLVSKPLYDQYQKICANRRHYRTQQCTAMEESMYEEMGGGINPYAVDFPVCTADGKHHGRSHSFSSQSKHLLNHTGNAPPFLPAEDKYKPCLEMHFTNYLKRQDVREALHVLENALEWEECSSRVRYSKKDLMEPQISLYKELASMAKSNKHKLNMLIFSGDDDSVCSLAGTQEWIFDLGVAPMTKHVWKPWKAEDQTAGYATHFDLGKKTEATLTLATVHGAGHEVPSFRPMEALQLFKRFLRGEW